jgi:hypothetical protein
VLEDGSPGRVVNAPSGMVDQVGNPRRISPASPENPPRGTHRLKGSVSHPPPQVGDAAVGLEVVAPTTRRDDVLPHMQTTAAPRDDVVKAGGRQVAVHASPAIASEDGPPGERNCGPTWHPHVTDEPNHRRHWLDAVFAAGSTAAAFCARTSTNALRSATTQSGSKVAFNTSARDIAAPV